MARWIYKIIMLVAVATIIGHNTLPHHHHEQNEMVVHHHHHDKEQGSGKHHHAHDEKKAEEHSIFSFAQLDENFVPVKFQVLNIELPIVYLFTPLFTYHYNLSREKIKTHFGYYKEYPPPENYLSQLTSRGPPSISNMA